MKKIIYGWFSGDGPRRLESVKDNFEFQEDPWPGIWKGATTGLETPADQSTVIEEEE